MEKMKKGLVVIFIGIVLVGFIFVFLKGKKTGSPSTDSGSQVSNQVVLPIEERPYLILVPRADGHELKLGLSNLKNIKSVDYELVYLAGKVSRGVIGSVDLKGESSFSRDLLLGSCSKNVCKYDEGVSSGTLTLKLTGTEGVQKYEASFHLQKGSQAKNGLTSGDDNFTFSGSFSSSSFYLISNTLGLPKNPPGKIIGGPYGVFPSGSGSIKGTIKLRLSQSSQTVKVLSWDGSSWKEYTKGFETDGQVVSVEVDRLTIFIAVAP